MTCYIFYFSGTGNTFLVTQWIKNEGFAKNIDVKLIPIEHNTQMPENIENDAIIGFLFPTHGFNAPPTVLKFLFNFPKGQKQKCFIMNTCAGMKIYKIFTPGLSGIAWLLPMLFLLLKNYKIVGSQPVDMPSNWIFLHPGLRKKVCSSIIEKQKKCVKKFTDKIFADKKAINRLIEIPFNIAVAPVAVGYYFAGRFFLAKTMIYTHNCNGCQICAKSCPANAIKMVANRPYWTLNCESCMRCINFCPQNAIQTSHSIFFVELLIFSLPIATATAAYFSFPIFDKLLQNNNIVSIIDAGIAIFISSVLYFILQRFLKWKLVSIIFKYTSLTNYWRLYKAPNIKLSNFRNKN